MGFINAQFYIPKKINDSTFSTTLNKALKTNFIKITNWDSLPAYIRKKFAFIKSKKRNLFPFQSTETLLQNINSEYSNAGSPFNKVYLNELSEKKDTLLAKINISETQKRTIDSIVIKGYTTFPKGFIKHYAGIKTDQVFEKQKVIEQTQQLNNLPFSLNFRDAEVLFNPNKTAVFLYLKRKPANNFDGFLGFSTEEETGNIKLDGYLNLNLINNLNFGEEINLTYKSDSEEQQQFRLNTKLPYIFKLPISLEAGIYIFRQEKEFSSTEQTLGLNYAFTPKFETFIGYKKIVSTDLNENENLVSINKDFDATYFNTELRYTKRKASKLFPFKTKITLGAEIGKRNPNTINQFKIGLLSQHIFQLNKRNSLYIANNAQYFQSENYLPNELYRLGGILSVRGFEENSLRASLFNVLNTEYRFLLNETIYVHSILDFAFIDNQAPRTQNSTEAIGNDQLTSFGVGLGMLTRAGLFKLNYANGRSKNIPFKFGNSKVHISLTAYF